MQMHTSRSINGGYLVGFTISSYCSRCSSMPQPLVRGSITVPSARADGSHQWSETWRWSHLPWSSSALNQERRLKKYTMMCNSCEGCQGTCSVIRRWRQISARRSWTLSKNASGVNGFPHCQGRNQDRGQLAS